MTSISRPGNNSRPLAPDAWLRPHEVRFVKGPLGAPADQVIISATRGRHVTMALPRQGTLTRAAIHFVVESTLGISDGLFGTLAESGALPPAAWRRRAAWRRVQALVDCLEAEQWGGATEPAVLQRKIITACRTFRVAPLALDPIVIQQLRAALRDFGAAWRPLRPGQSLTRKFVAAAR